MALLRPPDGSAPIPLLGRSTFGRGASATVSIQHRFASQEHAALRWTGAQWELRDLGSTNGTFVDGVRLEAGKPATVVRGNRLCFGDPAAAWELIDDRAPSAAAIDLESGAVLAATGEMLLLPDDAEPEITIYASAAGAWLAEHADGRMQPLGEGATLSAGGRKFRIELPIASEATPMLEARFSMENVTLRFLVRRDEEEVRIEIISRKKTVALEPRWFGYFLLTLARARQEDAGQPEAAQGWRDVEELLRMMRTDNNNMNVATHKARQQLASVGLEGAARIVEVRRGQRRLGTKRFEIRPLEG
ncbi:MAG: FHA domain-containing protein [Myxococcota bacterium]